MLTPDQIRDIPESMRSMLDKLEQDIIKDIARRIAKTGKITRTADWQIKLLAGNAVSKKHIKKMIAETLNIGDAEIDRIYKEATELSYIQDKSIYEAAGIAVSKPAAMDAFIVAAKQQTKNEFRNITRTLAFNGIGVNRFYDKVTLEVANAYIASLDKAIIDTASGAFTYGQAIKRAVKSMTDIGLETILYESEHRDRIDTATMRAVRTGINSCAKEITDMLINRYDTPLVEVSAHFGARPDHAQWQGELYYFNKPIKGYRSLVEVTGLGTVGGLLGANCRHSYRPFEEGYSVRAYTDAELKEMKNATVEYKGEKIPLYAATQKQRAIERGIRQTKREILAYDTIRKENHDMVDDNELKRLSMKLKERRAFYKDFSKETGLILRNERTQLEGFGRKEAARVRAGNISLEKAMNGLSGIETKNGIKVAGVAGHFKERLLGRGVSEDDVINALKNPLHIGKIKYGEKGSSQVFIGNNATIVINPDSGVLISTYPTGRERRKKYGKNQAPL